MGTEAKTDEAKGRVKEATGNLTGNRDLEAEGRTDRASGSMKQKVDDAGDSLKDGIDKLKGDDKN